jgi:hypothetical protein
MVIIELALRLRKVRFLFLQLSEYRIEAEKEAG